MFYPNFKTGTKINFEFERDPKSIFSIPNDNLTINIIHQMIDNIIYFDFIKDFDENISSNYEKESLLFNTFDNYFREIERNMTIDCYENVLKILNAIFFVLEYFTSWLHEIDKNEYKEIFETLSFYLNISIMIVLYFNFGYEGIKIDSEFIEYLKSLLKEIELFSSFLIENFNINSLYIYDTNNFINLFNLNKEDLKKNIYELLNCKLQKDGFLLFFYEYPNEHPLYKIKDKCLKTLNRIDKTDLGKLILK